MSKFASPLSLQQKVSLTLLALMGAMAALSNTVLDAQVAPAFEGLEIEAAETNMVRAQRALQADLDSLTTASNDWSIWDDAYAYMTGRYDAFADSNLETATLITLEMDLMLFFEPSGELRWGRFLVDQQEQPIDSLEILGSRESPDNYLLYHDDPQSEIRGPVRTAVGPMLLVSKPILTTAGTGPIAGTLVMGRALDDDRLATLRERTEVDFAWHQLDETSNSTEVELAAILDSPSAPVQHRQTSSSIISHTLIRDLFGDPLLLLHATTPRRISALGHQTVTTALLFLGVAAIVIVIVTWLLLRSIVVLPMESLARHIVGIRRSGDLSKRLNMRRNDELGALAEEFDKLTDEVSEARQLMLEQSFKAGRADTAAEVLHNIRNAMTPLINGIDRIGQQLGTAKKLKIKRATEEIRDPDCPEDRRDKLLTYVESAFDRVLESNNESNEELVAVSKQARQIEAIVSDQERHAKAAPVMENLALDEVISEAVLVIPKKKSPRVELDVQADASQFRIRGHRIGLLQVLGNILLNAYEAIQRSDANAGQICLQARRETVSDREMVRVTVSDTGCGFGSEEQQKIFQRGYSSKEGHLSGLGLHWCANALTGMDGRIIAESTGEGQGAQFHVLLPAA